MDKIEIKNMELYYGDFKAIKGIDLKLDESMTRVWLKVFL